jgi:prepilin-type processing-associated H-X9-DG protein
MGLAFGQYEQDYDETMVCGGTYDGYNLYAGGWAAPIYPYVKSKQVFVCPDDTGKATNGYTDNVSYGENANAIFRSGAPFPGTAHVLALNMMHSPAASVLLFEVKNCNAQGLGANWDITQCNPSNKSYSDCALSPAGTGRDSAGNMYGANRDTGSLATTKATSLKYNTGLLGNICINDVNSPCDVNPADANPGTSYYYASGAGVHTGGSNYLMADNHVKWLTPEKVSGGSDSSWFSSTGTGSCPATPDYAEGVDCSNHKFAVTFSFD